MSRSLCNQGIPRKDKRVVSSYWGDPHEPGQCWACKTKECTIQAAHITPKQSGGSNNEYNINLLCPVCHAESEPLRGASYVAWFVKKRLVYDDNGEYKEHITIEALRNLDSLIGMGRREVCWTGDDELPETFVHQVLQPLMEAQK